MKISEYEGYEQRKAMISLKILGIVMLLFIAFAIWMVFSSKSPTMKYGSFNAAVEDRVLAVLDYRTDLGDLLSMELIDPWANGYRVSAETSTHSQLIIYFSKDWEIQTIRDSRLNQVYP